MTKVRIAILVGVVVSAAAGTFALTKRIDDSKSSDSASSADNLPAPEPAMTTESIPQSRQEGLQPPPSDVAGISKPEGKR